MTKDKKMRQIHRGEALNKVDEDTAFILKKKKKKEANICELKYKHTHTQKKANTRERRKSTKCKLSKCKTVV